MSCHQILTKLKFRDQIYQNGLKNVQGLKIILPLFVAIGGTNKELVTYYLKISTKGHKYILPKEAKQKLYKEIKS